MIRMPVDIFYSVRQLKLYKFINRCNVFLNYFYGITK
jgi:hypothetical protein